MNIWNTAIFVIVSLSLVIIYFTYIILLSSLERYFINKRSKAEIILPIISLLVSLLLFLLIGNKGVVVGSVNHIIQGIVLFIPAIINIAIYVISKCKRKKKNMLMKMKLKDL